LHAHTTLDFSLPSLREAYAHQAYTPSALIKVLLTHLQSFEDNPIWIYRLSETALIQRAAALESLPASARQQMPLYGIPFAIKDNIDVAGLPTTAGCPDYAYVPTQTATTG
jgi:Asp-tRNA(Asn)/Glu-tRNA(Gln) amidotransferase A subunit family amidase